LLHRTCFNLLLFTNNIFLLKARRQASTWRFQTKENAAVAVSKFLKYKSKKTIISYVNTAFNKPHIPFHWAYYEETDIPEHHGNGYKINLRGAFQSPMVLRAFAAFYSNSGARFIPSHESPIEDVERDCPVGALALACVAVWLFLSRTPNTDLSYFRWNVPSRRIAPVSMSSTLDHSTARILPAAPVSIWGSSLLHSTRIAGYKYSSSLKIKSRKM